MQGAWLYAKGACRWLLQMMAAAEPLPGQRQHHDRIAS